MNRAHRLVNHHLENSFRINPLVRRTNKRQRMTTTTTSSSFQTLPILHLPCEKTSSETEKDDFISQLRHSCHNIGFFYIKNHGVKEETYLNSLKYCKDFFDLPLEKKMNIDYRESPAFRGYMNLGCENTAGRPDRREQIEFGPEEKEREEKENSPYWMRLVGPNQWPDNHIPQLRVHVSNYMAEMEILSRKLMKYLALSLDLSDTYFDETFGNNPNVQFKICRYPPVDFEENEHGFGVGAHTDSGYLSLLLQDGVGGLQVQNGKGEWIDAPPIENTIVVNLGEMIEVATCGYFKATPHRVLNMTNSSSLTTNNNDNAKGGGRGRFSMPYFWNPSLDYTVKRIDLPETLLWEREKKPVSSAVSTQQTEDSCYDGSGSGRKNNILHLSYGENAFKSLSRSHPEVMKRHHTDLLEDNILFRQ